MVGFPFVVLQAFLDVLDFGVLLLDLLLQPPVLLRRFFPEGHGLVDLLSLAFELVDGLREFLADLVVFPFYRFLALAGIRVGDIGVLVVVFVGVHYLCSRCCR